MTRDVSSADQPAVQQGERALHTHRQWRIQDGEQRDCYGGGCLYLRHVAQGVENLGEG